MCSCPRHVYSKGNAGCNCYCIHKGDGILLRAYKRFMVRRGFGALYWIAKKQENAAVWVANKLPRWLVYRAVIRAGVETIRDDEEVPAVMLFTVLERWHKKEVDRAFPAAERPTTPAA